MNTNFRIINSSFIDDIKSEVYILEHTNKAKVVYVKNKDDNKVFSISFRTPPENDCGTAHIMEHILLAGSKKYKIKEPFNELLKSTLFTYLNAMTDTDVTIFPVASLHEFELLKMADIYLDGVFNPSFKENKFSFLQEGWHNFIDDNGEIKIGGIVFNEMKSSFSDIDYLTDYYINQNLFNNCYKFCSAGHPDFITELDLKKLTDFYDKFYRPDNCIIYIYGNLNVESMLEKIHNSFSKILQKVNVPIKIGNETNNLKHNSVYKTIKYNGENTSTNHIINGSFIIGEKKDLNIYNDFKILNSALFNEKTNYFNGIFCKKFSIGEILESKFIFNKAQIYINFKLQNSKLELKDFHWKINNIFEELKVVDFVFVQNLINGAFNKLQFNFMEADYGYKPKGLAYNLEMLSQWLYDGDILKSFQIKSNYEKAKNRLIDKKYFNDIVENKFLQNNEISFINLVDEKPKNVIKKTYEIQQIKEIEFNKKLLEIYQNEEDKPEELDKIKLLDFNKILYKNENEIKILDGDFKTYHLETQIEKIIYCKLIFNCDCLDENEINLLNIYCSGFNELLEVDNDLKSKINFYFGELKAEIKFNKSFCNSDFRIDLVVSYSFIKEHFQEVEDILHTILFTLKLDNYKTVKKIIKQMINEIEKSIIKNDELINTSVKSCFENCYELESQILGIKSYLNLLNYEKQGTTELFLKSINRILSKILNKRCFSCAVASSKKDIKSLEKSFQSIYNRLINVEIKKIKKENVTEIQNFDVEFINFSKNTFTNSLAIDVSDIRLQKGGILKVLAKVIEQKYLMEEVRLKGGAYGFRCYVNDDILLLSSFSDPNMKNTFDIFIHFEKFIRQFITNKSNYSKREFDSYKLGVISDLDRPLLKKNEFEIKLSNFFSNYSSEQINFERKQILKLTLEDFHEEIASINLSLKNSKFMSLGNIDLS